jgi:hypothetical protein
MAARKATGEKVEKTVTAIEVIQIAQHALNFRIIGTSPLIFNAVSNKAKKELLFPQGRRSIAERATTAKHDPHQEYIDSTYRFNHNSSGTRLYLKTEMFKAAMMTAALDVPGLFKTQIGRLIWVEGHAVPVYGEPVLKMDIVRMADQKKTPDVRTRAILPEWATAITVCFQDLIKTDSIVNLLAAAGVTAGVADYRQEKGKGSFGQFRPIYNDDDALLADWNRITKDGGRAVQDRALAEPSFFDGETEELYLWFYEEKKKRAKAGPKLGPRLPAQKNVGRTRKSPRSDELPTDITPKDLIASTQRKTRRRKADGAGQAGT